MGLPTGPAVTFLFTDIEGSTKLERAVGSVAWAEVTKVAFVRSCVVSRPCLQWRHDVSSRYIRS